MNRVSREGPVLRVGRSDGDRYDRMRRIEWIDMDAVHSARILVAGAGALGNEVVKNLILAGFRMIDVADMDDIVVSNLSRCLFFRDRDVKKVMKSDVVAERASEMDPDARISSIPRRIQDIDYWNYDIALGCLDNIAARMHLNSHTYFRDIPYIDGATDGFRGKVHVVLPGGPCLQCTMNRTHVREAEKRFTCTGSSSVYVPRMAADITTTAVIAAMQVREALKIASGRVDMCLKHIAYYNGENCEMFTAEASVDPECVNHLLREGTQWGSR
ncbi:MAG: ThiF family adenylyltransferase [Candidatus Methanomethylophilaceae archaeon]|nr:ThiF family adenylyltransferase [Candidatus Methanomethylophilaceae archaeon]